MGNSHSNRTVHAAESQGGIFDSFRSAFSSSPPPAAKNSSDNSVLQSPTSTIHSPLENGSGDAPSQTKAEVDPRTIATSIPETSPGSWNELHKVKEIFPNPNDGVKLTLNKGLSHNFQVSHNFTLGTMQPSGYKFGATLVGSKMLSQSETYPVVLGEIDPSGNMNAQIIHAFTQKTRSRLVTQFQGNTMAALETGTDYRGDHFTASVTAANPDLLAMTGIYVAHGLYALTPKISIGAEGIIHRGMNPTLRQIATQFSGSVAAKYTNDKLSATAQVSPMERALHLSYWHRLNDHQVVGVEMEGKGLAGEASATVGYAFDIPNSDCTVKAQIDTNLTLATTLERKLSPLPMNLVLSVQANQKKAQYLTGIGLTVG